MTSHFWPKKTSFLHFSTKKELFTPFWSRFRQNGHRKRCSPWCVEYFEKQILSCDVTFLAYDILKFLTKMSCLHPVKVVFRQNCHKKCWFSLCVEYLKKYFCPVTSHFWRMSFFGPKRRLFCNFWQRWVVYALLKSFSGKTVRKKLFFLMCRIFRKSLHPSF